MRRCLWERKDIPPGDRGHVTALIPGGTYDDSRQGDISGCRTLTGTGMPYDYIEGNFSVNGGKVSTSVTEPGEVIIMANWPANVS